MFQGPKIILICATLVITNGIVIEKIKHTSRIARTAEYYDRVPQAGLNSTSAVAPAIKNSTAEEAPTTPTLLSEDVGAMKPVENEGEINSKRKTRVVNSFDDAVGFPSPPASRRNIVERLKNPSRVVRAVRHSDVTSEYQTPTAFSEHMDGHTGDLEHSSRAEREAILNEGPSVQPEEAYDDLKGGERIERLSNLSRSVRQTFSCPLVCRKTYTPTYPVSYPHACHRRCPATCTIICPVTCPTATTPYPCCGRPTTGTSSQTFRLPYRPATNNVRILNPGVSCSPYSGTPAQGNFRIAYPRTSHQQQHTTCFTAPRKKTFTCPATTAAPPTGFMTGCGNDYGGNRICSSINMLSGPSCTDRCSNQNACMFSKCGNGYGGNNVKSCINYVHGGNMFCNCGEGEGGNCVQSVCNIVDGDGASLTDGSGVTVLKSLCNMFIGQNCSPFGCNSCCGDNDCSEEHDPCCCQSRTACPVDRSASQTAYTSSPVSSDPCYPRPTTYSCDPWQPSPPTNNYPPYVMLPGNPFYSCKKK